MQSPVGSHEIEMLAQFADELADVTDAMAMTYFRKPLDVETKDDLSPVTQADRARQLKSADAWRARSSGRSLPSILHAINLVFSSLSLRSLAISPALSTRTDESNPSAACAA